MSEPSSSRTAAPIAVFIADRRRLIRDALAQAILRQPDLELLGMDDPSRPSATPADVIVFGPDVATDEALGPVVFTEQFTSLDAIIEEIRQAHQTPVDSEALLNPAEPAPADLPSLSPRELEVLWQASKGKSAAEIGDQLGISSRTVEEHKTRLLSKLDARSPAEAVRRALDRGILTDPDEHG